MHPATCGAPRTRVPNQSGPSLELRGVLQVSPRIAESLRLDRLENLSTRQSTGPTRAPRATYPERGQTPRQPFLRTARPICTTMVDRLDETQASRHFVDRPAR